jgi:hypothetical protein
MFSISREIFRVEVSVFDNAINVKFTEHYPDTAQGKLDQLDTVTTSSH